MALTFTTGMTLASAADSATNWNVARIAGSGQAPAFGGSDATIKKEGSASNSSKIAVASTDAVHILDWYANAEGGKTGNTTVDLTAAGSEVVCGWVQITTVGALQTQASGGLYLLLSSSTDSGVTAPTVYSKWYIGGSDNYPGGWLFFAVDTRKTASATAGGGCNLAAVRRVGVGVLLTAAPGTIKADNIFVDAIWYGRPNYKVVGDGTLTASWASFLTDSVTTKQNGLIEKIGGTMFLSCGIQLGDSAQGATTTFLDATGQRLEFKRYTYYQGGIVDALNYGDYYIVKGDGAASYRTSITFGSVVGTGDNRQGVLGGSLSSPDTTNLTWKADFQTNKSKLSAVKLYGLDISGAKGGVLLDNDSGGTETVVVSGAYINCGEVDPGTTGNGAEMLNIAVINPLGGTTANRGLRMPSVHRIKKVSCITSGTPTTQHLIHLPTGGTYSIVFDAIKFFGDFSSGTLWHGETSNATQSAIELTCSNGSSPDAAEVDKTGHASTIVTVNNPVILTLTGLIANSEVRIYTAGTITELGGVENSGTTFQYNYTYQAGTYVDIVVHKADRIYWRLESYLLSDVNASLPVQQQVDRQYANP